MARACSPRLVIMCGVALAGAVAPARAAEYDVLHAFQGGDGELPRASLIDVGGTLYGTTVYGGGALLGTAFSLNLATGVETVLHSFGSGRDGLGPDAGLIRVGSRLCGTTYGGGVSGDGAVYSLSPATGAERVVFSLSYAIGASPLASLLDVGGMLYGTTAQGGTPGVGGTVFSLNPRTGTGQAAYSFQGGADGAAPVAGLIDVGGTLYGTTTAGGAAGLGTVFSWDPATGAERVVYSFQGGSDGDDPAASLIAVGGRLYGTTASGGSTDCGGPGWGTVFSLDLAATGAEKVVHVFKGGSDGAIPRASLINVAGTLYGTTEIGGGSANCKKGCGTVFAIKP